MGQRTTYFCDWCGITSPLETCVPNAWKRVDVSLAVPERYSTVEKCILCEGCLEAIEKAVAGARTAREALRKACGR